MHDAEHQHDEQHGEPATARRGWRCRSTNSTPSSAIIEPTDSSMPPVMMTKAWPIANRPNRPIRLAVLARLIGDRKRGLMNGHDAPTTRISRSRPRSFFSMTSRPPPRCRSRCPTASRSTFSSLNSSRSRKPAIRPSCITAMRSLTPITSSMSLEIISTATPASASAAHQPVDLGLGADVDAARRLVEDHHLRLHRQPLGEHDLLLVAARQRADARVDRSASGCRAPRCCSRRCAVSAPPRISRPRGDRPAGWAARCSRRSAGRAAGRCACGPRARGRCRGRSRRAACGSRHGCAVEPDRAAERSVDAEDGAGQFGAAGADQAARPRISPRRSVEVDRLRRDAPGCARPTTSSTGVARRARPAAM